MLLFSRFPRLLCFACLHLHAPPICIPLRVCLSTTENLSHQSFAEPRTTLVAVSVEGTSPRSLHAKARLQRGNLLLQPAGLVQRESAILQRPRRWLMSRLPPGWGEEWGRNENNLPSHSSCCCYPPRDMRETKLYFEQHHGLRNSDFCVHTLLWKF